MSEKFFPSEKSAEIGGFSLSTRHREVGLAHFEQALEHQEKKLREKSKDVIDWIAEHIPNTSIVLESVGKVNEVDPISSIFAKRSKRDVMVVTNEIYKLRAVFAAPEDALAFKLRWA